MGGIMGGGLVGTRAQAAEPVEIVAFGDSLTAGYGLASGAGFADQLQARLDDEGIAAKVINAGVSGDTATGGQQRLEWSVPETADAVIVELGANDALRGVDPKVTRAALTKIVTRLQERGQKVLLAGMYAPPNLGDEYGEAFNAIYPDLAKETGVLFYPFFLDGVALDDSLKQPDGLHPTKEGVTVIVDNILPKVKELIEEVREEKAPE
ncbi:arylesterase [Afifella sp. H1R]|uniref:arylesterase n=1 Tax=Afifella sp. H1R TaxID=2908841 RepID=UPI001F339941|nr:arylesterase [Afifella sp. H1R]MCF1505364.1 arylesterase [Afifella sp. H1R]